MCFFFHAQSKWLTFSEFSKSPIHIVKAECICKVWVCIRKPLLLFSEACEAVYLCCDSIRFSSLSQQKHLNPTHLTLTQKERCDVACMCERVHVRARATANVCFGLLSLGPVFYFVGEWGSTEKTWLGSELYPSFAFLPLTKTGRTRDKRSNY